jgi:hypothetical protein
MEEDGATCAHTHCIVAVLQLAIGAEVHGMLYLLVINTTLKLTPASFGLPVQINAGLLIIQQVRTRWNPRQLKAGHDRVGQFVQRS